MKGKTDIEKLRDFLQYFADLQADDALHLLDLEGPSEMSKRFKPIAKTWEKTLDRLELFRHV